MMMVVAVMVLVVPTAVAHALCCVNEFVLCQLWSPKPPSSFNARFVGIFPNGRQDNSWVETMEDGERYRTPQQDCPGQLTEELQLHGIRFDFLSLEGVDDPHGKVADEQEGDDLPTGFGSLVFGQSDLTSLSILDENHLNDDLKNWEAGSN